jgi:hypothetical protein
MARSVKISAHRIITVDGKPMFPVLARHMPKGGTPALLAEAGFDAFRVTPFGVDGGKPEPIPSKLDGIGFWAYLFDRADFTKSSSHECDLVNIVKELRSHPSLLCYENCNEPTLRYKSGEFKTQPADLARGTAVIRELDPQHPIWLAHCCSNMVQTLQQYNDSLDIVGCNPYPVYVPGMRRHIGMREDGRVLDCIDQSIHAVGKYTDKMMAVAQGRPVWMLIQAMSNESWFNPHHTPQYAGQEIDASKMLYPTYEQMRFMAFDAIIAGATGIGLSMYGTPIDGPVWKDICRLVAELKSLQPALCAPPLPQPIAITYTDLGYSIWDGVRTLIRRNGDDIYLFAANTAADPAEVSIQLGIPVRRTAKVCDSDREFPVGQNSIHDCLAGFGVQVYHLRGA